MATYILIGTLIVWAISVEWRMDLGKKMFKLLGDEVWGEAQHEKKKDAGA